MKIKGLLKCLQMMLAVAFRYAQQHSASLVAMKARYARQWIDENDHKEYTKTLAIIPRGSIYSIVEQLCLENKVIKEESWTATYGWHSNGHMIEIGGFRYCIFDPLHQCLYLEFYNSEDEKEVAVYQQI